MLKDPLSSKSSYISALSTLFLIIGISLVFFKNQTSIKEISSFETKPYESTIFSTVNFISKNQIEEIQTQDKNIIEPKVDEPLVQEKIKENLNQNKIEPVPKKKPKKKSLKKQNYQKKDLNNNEIKANKNYGDNNKNLKVQNTSVATKANYNKALNELLSKINKIKAYPSRARKLKLEGRCELLFKINQQGEVLSYTLHKSTSKNLLDVACRRIGKQLLGFNLSHFGSNLEVTVPINFKLKNL